MRSITIKIKDKGPRLFEKEVARHLRNLAYAVEGDSSYEEVNLVPSEFDLGYYDLKAGKFYVTGKVTIK